MLLFAQNIKYLRNRKSLSQQRLADIFEISRGQLASYEDNRAEPNMETLIKLSNYFKLPIDTLIKHNITKSKEESYLDIGNNRILFPIIVNEENQDLIEVIPQRASAGYLAGYSDPDYIESLPQMKLPFVPTGKHRAFPIKGDSMEPFVKEGAFVVAKFVEEINHIKDGQTYIVITNDDGIVYKRLYNNLNTLTLKSDNNFYPPYDIEKGTVLELWEYSCKIDLQNYDKEELNLESIMNMMRSMQIELENIKNKID